MFKLSSESEYVERIIIYDEYISGCQTGTEVAVGQGALELNLRDLILQFYITVRI